MGLDIVFFLASLLAVGSATLAVTRRNAVHSAAWMMGALFALAVIFLLLRSEFLSIIQVLLYAGAILVLFVFVIMLLNPGPEMLAQDRPPPWLRALAGIFALGLVAALGGAVLSSGAVVTVVFSDPGAPLPPERFGGIEWFGHTVYDTYLLAFELVSLLIMAAIAGAVVIGKRRIEGAADVAEEEGGTTPPPAKVARAAAPRAEPAAGKGREVRVEDTHVHAR